MNKRMPMLFLLNPNFPTISNRKQKLVLVRVIFTQKITNF